MAGRDNRKAPIVLDAATTHSLARLTQPCERAAENDLSAAAMLSQLHSIAGMLLQEVRQTESEPLAKRIGMAKDLAKLIPMLASAERKVHKGVGHKDVEDMTDRELKIARRKLQAR